MIGSTQGTDHPPRAPRRLFVHRADYLMRQRRPDMLIDRMLARAGVAVVAAPPYAGKTFLALEAMRAVAYGEPFLGHFPVPRAGNVLYLGNDSPAWDIESQFEKLIGLPDPVLEDVGLLMERTALGSFGFIFDHTFQLRNVEDADAVIDAAKRQWSTRDFIDRGDESSYREVSGTDLIVIDTLRSIHQYEENDNTQMQHVMNLLRYVAVSTGAAILALHHFNKANKESPAAALDRLRGATAIGGAVDSVFAITGKWPSLAVRVLKNRPCPEQGDFMYQIDSKDGGYEMRVGEASGIVNLAAKKAVLRALGDSPEWVKTSTLEKAVAAALDETNAKKIQNATGRVLKVLEDDGRVARIHGAARLADIQPRGGV